MSLATVIHAAAAAITATIASLGVGGYRESTAIDNSTNNYLDAVVSGSIQVGLVTASGSIEIYAYASGDGGTTYSGGLAGVDETIVWGTTPATSSIQGYTQLALLDVISVDAADDDNDIEFVCKTTVAAAFGGVMPERWGLVIKNSTDIALHAVGTNNALKFQGIKYDIT